MQSSRRLAFLLALTCAAMPAAFAQSSSGSAQAPDQSSSSSQAQQSGGLTQGQLTVQERIRQRREQRRAAAIHDAYDRRWETFIDMGYLRAKPGPSPTQRLTYYGWETGLTRYVNERLGFTLDGRGYLGIAYVGLNQYSQGAFTRPQVSMYNVLFGPTYRFYVQPKYSISGRALGGWAYGNFSGDTNGISPKLIGLYPDGSTFGVNLAVVGEYNVTPGLAIRLAGEDMTTHFGSEMQNDRGFTSGIVYRFGKQ
ncbi:MAG: hypothetical protein ACP5E2_09015 [Terracidiphilus sp.]